ncbi:MAG: methionine synthase, partial [Anaerolineales bacterium]
QGVKFVFGGTPPVVEKVARLGFFDACFDGTQTTEEIIAYLKGRPVSGAQPEDYPQTTVERILWKRPFPLIRHHFGLPTRKATEEGIREIARSGMLDVISLGIDQDAQENFFHPERQEKRRTGAGGVPVRTPDDYRRLYQASRTGNYPLMRTYSGTDDFIRLAEMYVDTIHIAWAAVPLFWFNQMDGRGPWGLEASIRKHQELYAWYGERNIPVEANEAHHWGMRDAPDAVFVLSAYLAAYNARHFGVRDHIVQMMFNSPPGLSDAMDIAKMVAVKEMISRLEDQDFNLWWQTRTGLLSYPIDKDQARAHLATSVFVQAALKPDIIHVVGYPEADHAVTAGEVIESCKLARKAIVNAMNANLDLTELSGVQARAQELITETSGLLEKIQQLGAASREDPLTDPANLAKAVAAGILDAPQLVNNKFARGDIVTRIDDRGACIAEE